MTPLVKPSIESETERLANKVLSLYEQCPTSKRILVGISGIPGSGKSTIARQVVNSINGMYKTMEGKGIGPFAVDIPMDGYHYTRAQLAAMEDPEIAIHRRGAAFTFDAGSFCKLVEALHEPVTPDTKTIYAPSFDHAVKDPVADGIPIDPSSRIVVFEGLYLCLEREPWSSAARLMDELWFVTIDREIARQRLAKRHVASGIVPDENVALYRIDSTDFLNADDILENCLEVDEQIRGDI